MATFLSPGVYGTEVDLSTSVPSVATGVSAYAGAFAKGEAFKRILVSNIEQLVNTLGVPSDSNYNDFYQCYNFLKNGSELYVVRAVNNDDDATPVYPAYVNGKRYLKGETVTYLGATIKALVETTETPKSSVGTFQPDTNWGNSTGLANQKKSMNSSVGITAANSGEFKNYYMPNSSTFSLAYEDMKNSIIMDSSNLIFIAKSIGLAGNNISVSFSNDLSKCIEYPSVNLWNGIGSSAWASSTYMMNDVVVYNNRLYKSLIDTNTVIPTSDKTKWEDISHKAGDVVFANGFNWTSKVSNNEQEPSDTSSKWTKAYSFDDLFEGTLHTDGSELAVIVFENGVLVEKYIVSTKENGLDADGNNIFIDNILSEKSSYIYSVTEQTSNTPTLAQQVPLSGGVYAEPSTFDLVEAYDLFKNSEDFDVSLIIANEKINQICLDIANDRKDCVAIAGAPKELISSQTPASFLTEYVSSTLNVEGSYAAFYGNYIQILDTYNSKYRWVNIAGAVAGSQVRTNNSRDAWWANAGLERGQISNVIKIAFNPTKGERDLLYRNKINPIVSMPGQGNCIIWGQKTMLSRSSAFDRLNVRQLFLVIEKAVNKAMKYFVFEPNDEFTRAQVIAMIGPFLEEIKGRRGVYDYKVICDETINTPEVIDNNILKVNVLVKPTRIAEFISIQYVATKTGADLSEIAKAIA